MNTKALRQKILDLAIHGKLVPQDPNDEPASVLLERIRDEKERLIKEGKIKRPKKTKATSDKPHYENVPFDVPSSWEWTTLGEITSIIGDGLHGTPQYDIFGNYFFINGNNLVNRTIVIKEGTKKVSDDEYVKYRKPLNERTILVSINGTIGNVGTYNGEKIILGKSACYFNLLPNISKSYICNIIESDYFRKYAFKSATGSTIKNVPLKAINDFYIPLPPLQEQRRIVESIEHRLSFVGCIEFDKKKLQETIKLAKSKVLDLAIHGKLVPQDPTDEPAAELLKRINPKAEITCDNGHYQKLPEGWAVCCLENVAEVLDNLRKPINSNERNSRIANKHESELFPYYGATGQVGFIDDYLIDGKFLLLGEDGAPFLDKYAIKSYPIKGKCWVNNHAHILKPLCDFDYLMYYLNHVDYKDYVNGSTRLKLTQSDMRSIKILLPPLTEQKRISVKIKYLFCLLDTIACHL